MKKELKQIKDLCEKLLDKMGLKLNCEVNIVDEIVFVNIKAGDDLPEKPLLIGNRGEHLSALQHLMRLLVNKIYKRPVHLILDIDGYKEKQKQRLFDLAKKLAQKVKKTRRFEILRPMSSYERRIIHLALSEAEGVTTQSIGEEPNRRIMIKPEE